MRVFLLDNNNETITYCGDIDDNDESAEKEFMNEFFKKNNFRSCYQRYWKSPAGDTICDFGSHVKFLVFENKEGNCTVENYFGGKSCEKN